MSSVPFSSLEEGIFSDVYVNIQTIEGSGLHTQLNPAGYTISVSKLLSDKKKRKRKRKKNSVLKIL